MSFSLSVKNAEPSWRRLDMAEIHERLVELLSGELSERIAGEPEFLYDGLKVKLRNGLLLSIIYPRKEEYIFMWEQGGKLCRIDTAPVHEDLETGPTHFHCGTELKEDGITSIQNDPEDNLRNILEFIAST